MEPSENLRTIQRLVEAFDESGFEGMFGVAELFDSAFEFREPPEQPGAGVFVGLPAAQAAFGRWAETWESQTSAAESYIEEGDRILLFARQTLRGRDGMELVHDGSNLWTMRDGRVLRYEAFWDRANALGAAGFEDETPRPWPFPA